MSFLKKLFHHYVFEHRWSYTMGALCLVATNYFSVAIPVQIGFVIDNLGEGEVRSHIQLIAIMGAAIIVVRTFSRVLFFNPGRDIEYAIRRDLFSKLLDQQAPFYAGHNRGDIISRSSSDIAWVRAMIGFGGLQAVNISLALSMTGWKMFSISWEVTVMALIPILSGTILVQLLVRSWTGLMRQNQEEVAAISEHVLESCQAVATIQAFEAKKAFKQEFNRRNQMWQQTGMRLAILRSATIPIITLVGGGAVFSLIYVGGPMVQRGELTIGNIATFIALIAAITPYMRSMGWLFSVWHRGNVALERIFELLYSEVECPEGADPIRTDKGHPPAISVQNLNFAYPDDPDCEILKNISFEISAGSMIGIFGRTGSGKSTLLRILSRVYNPSKGSVFIDEEDICDFDLLSWRRRISVVPQRPFLFGDSIRSNIGMGADISEEELQSVVQLASLTQDLPALPNGLDTIVGERGIMLSGGQRQRVALARGLIQRGDLFLLDDVLSAVDHENEQKLVDSIANVKDRENRPTCIIVSNRISAFRHSDRILVMEEGRLIDCATHQELINKEGVYRDSYLAQREEA